MEILQYEPSMKARWDAFVDKSKNGTFLLKRDYMEYHSDRFKDHSFVFVDNDGKFTALLPANIEGDVLYSHKGLTYGGLTMSATLSVRNLSTAIEMREPMRSSRLGKRALKRQRQNDIVVEEVDSVSSFWDIIVEDRRVRHNVRPVHTADELNCLKSKFPENIRIYIATVPASQDGSGAVDAGIVSPREIVGGAVIYLDKGVIHLQYAACTPQGKDLYATDVIYHELIFNIFPQSCYFDFGISNEDAGRYLNQGMVAHKEEFGGRSVVYDIYEMDI